MLKHILPVLLLLPVLSGAQERLTLHDAIRKALEHNYDIRVAMVAAEQARVQNTPGNAGMLPDISAAGSYGAGSANTHIEFVDGRIMDVDNALSETLTGDLLLNWTLFDGGRMFIVKKQLSEMEAIGNVQLQASIQKTVSEVIQAYAQSVLLQQQIAAVDTGLLLARERMVLSKAQFETGSSAKVDYLQARVDLNARRSDSLFQAASLTGSLATLNMLMGVRAQASYRLDTALTVNTVLQPKDAAMLEELNPDLDLSRRNAHLARLREKEARSMYLPTLNLNGGYAYTRTASQAGFALFNRSSGPRGALQLNVPLFMGGNVRRNARVASLQAFSNELLYERQQTDLGRAYRTAWAAYRAAVEAYTIEEENIGFARENMLIQRERFRVGVATTLETREAENSLVVALQRLYAAAHEVKVRETQILELEGGLIRTENGIR